MIYFNCTFNHVATRGRARAACRRLPLLLTAVTALALVGCGTLPKQGGAPSAPVAHVPAKPQPGVPALPAAGSGRGGYYQDDGPGDNPPPNLDQVPDAQVRNDPLLPRSNRPYVVFGKTYTPITGDQPFVQRGVGSWYGKKFHGQRTSSGELYDMYKMTAAHPTLPIPSYARLTSLVSGVQVIVRINDRGPFHSNRAIDVSYTAALKLGLLGKGSHELQIERILPAEVERMLAARAAGGAQAASQPSPSPAVAPLVLAPQPVPQPVPKAAPGLMKVAFPSDMQALMQGDGAASAQAADTVATSNVAYVDATAGAGASADVSKSNGAADKGGFYLQLGAYSRADNAEAVRVKLERASTGLGALEVVQGGTVHRLFSGPFASRQEALQAAQGVPLALSLKPIVIQR